MKNGATYFKWSVVLIGIIAVVYLFRGCFGGKGKTEYKEIVKIVRDTMWLQSGTDTHYVAKPYKVTIHDTLEYESDPIVIREPLPPLVRKAFDDWNSTKYFSDSFSVDYGKLYLYDTLRSGKLRKGFSLRQSIPVITNTITLREKPRIKAYAGIEVMGTMQSPISYTGVSFSLLMKNQNIIGIKGGLMKNGNELYGIEYKRLIKLRK